MNYLYKYKKERRKSMTNFMFNEIETVEVPCNGCFWGGVGAVLAGVGLGVSIALT